MALLAGLALLAAISQVAGKDIQRSYGSTGRSSNPRYCGYTVARHEVRARDGYITTVFRLPRSSGGEAAGWPVLLQHGFLSSSDTWYQIGNISLSCMLARAGYDVWLSNTRGNSYSLLHAWLDPYRDYYRYWDFSFHEMAVNDLPATIDYITKVTKKDQVSYIGHSMGGTLDYTLLSEVPEYNKKIKVAVSLAPAVYISPVITTVIGEASPVMKWFSCTVAFLPWPNGKLDLSGSKRSDNFDELRLQTLKTLDYLLNEKGKKRVSLGYDRTSGKTMQHLAQLVCSGRFQDFGTSYFSFLPWNREYRKYNLANVKTRHFIMYSYGDWIVRGRDVRRLCNELPENVRQCHEVPRHFGHFDFLGDNEAKVHVNDHVLTVLGRHLPPSPTTTTTTTTTEAVNPECLV